MHQRLTQKIWITVHKRLPQEIYTYIHTDKGNLGSSVQNYLIVNNFRPEFGQTHYFLQRQNTADLGMALK